MTVRTRFAPSPTGPLHIGGVRTALFNYLYSRHQGGEFLLRIEDTDRERSTEAATQGILDSLEWLGLHRDGPTVFQSTRMDRHAKVARDLLAAGKAYHCFCTPEELAAEREQARLEKRVWRYDGRWRDRDPATAPAGVTPVIRLKTQRDGETELLDLVQGAVRVANAELDDMIILRSDGTPTYNHSVVVDDHDMAITHVIRGDDHLTNTFRQIQVYRALNWDLPRFAHIPLIHGADGAKLSKRHGAQFALEFRDQGFLPEALCNYLLRLGWSHGDLEILGREEAIRLFDIVDVNRGPSRMDYAKLTNLNGVYIRQADDDRLTRDVLHRLAHRPDLSVGGDAAGPIGGDAAGPIGGDAAGPIGGDAAGPIAGHAAVRIRALMPALKERAKTLVELADSAAFLARVVPLPMEPKAAAALTAEARLLLRDVGAALAETDFSVAAIDAALRAFAESRDLKLGQVAQPLRAALTGSTVSPGIDATLAALGRAESLARIGAASG
jgi:glutamyl-tRNA synthetase